MEDMRYTNKVIKLLLIVVLVTILSITVSAEVSSGYANIVVNDVSGYTQSALTDDYIYSVKWLSVGDVLTIESQDDVSGLYIKWQTYPEGGIILRHGDEEYTHNSGYLQDYIYMDVSAGETLSMEMAGDCVVMDIYCVTGSDIPTDVHEWYPPLDNADILVLPTHADDEHLFFGGVMPTYIDMGDVAIQVAYMVSHDDAPHRRQELLNGLWVAGIRNYPVIPSFPDHASRSLDHAKTVYSADEILDYTVGLVEEFQPKVIVGHDLNGEYGHGGHMLFAETLTKVVEMDLGYPQKLYLHLYPENEIIMDVETPLDYFNGQTAFDVAVAAFAEHVSQSQDYYVAASGPYDLRKFGLYYSAVGADTGNDMLENIQTYADEEWEREMRQQELDAQEAADAEYQEQQRLEQEARDAAEAERIAAEEERLAAEAATEQAFKDAEASQRLMALSALGVLFAVLLVYYTISRSRRKK